ncbi:hypothetical protein LTR70_005200 [Exophiala xenobiotica]|uniref:Uncharacterized protein n=1 Tax=Lithohypha guttulata TaxID=1690604 RepID=A0ABR0KCW0_9EURO|nr:hypothetical protein LTR24_004731 [Lithohypha guttulata]KAK5318904.1 hypothetical protein LTR70_005200 [Exophiala xenobiotica]
MDTQAPVLPARNQSSATSIFRLLDLPQEIQDKVYDMYFQGCTLKLQGNAVDDSLMLRLNGDADGQNDVDDEDMVMHQSVTNPAYSLLDIELVCRKVHLDARRARSRVWPRTVSLELSRYRNMGFQLRSRKYAWLQNHIDTFKVDTETLLGQSSLFFPVTLNSFPHLRHLEFDGRFYLPLNDHVLTFQAPEEPQRMTKDGSLINAHRTCIRRHGVQALANQMAQKFGSEYSIRGTSHIIDVETGSTNVLMQDVSFEFNATGFRVTAQASDHEKVNAVLQSTMSPQNFMPYESD